MKASVCVILVLLFLSALMAQSRDILYSSDFEGLGVDWLLAGQFEVGVPGNINACYTAYSGTNILGTNLTGNYLPDQGVFDNYAQSPIINCEGAENLKVTYWSFSKFQGYEHDIGYLYIKVDGLSWTMIDKVEYNQENKWSKHYVDISELADGHLTIQFRFSYLSNENVQMTGWNIDDFMVLEAAPFNGSKSINPAGAGGGGNYTTFTSAIEDINLHGIGAGGLTVNVAAGSVFNEDIPPLVVSGNNISERLIFQKSGVGSNPIIIPTGTEEVESDAAFTLWGCQWVYITGIDIESSSNLLEYGYYICNNDMGDGAQHIEISNCQILIDSADKNGTAIRQDVWALPTGDSGSNSNNSYHHNTIQAPMGITLSNLYALETPYDDLNCMVFNNQISGFTALPIPDTPDYFAGVQMIGSSDAYIHNNTIANGTVTRGGYGIENFYGSGIQIYQNTIYNLTLLNQPGAYAVTGIKAEGSKIYNNVIHSLYSLSIDDTTNYSVKGIYAERNTQIDFNSIYLKADAGTQHNSSAIFMDLGVGYVLIRNNILVSQSLQADESKRHHCITSPPNFYGYYHGLKSNHNICYATGVGAMIGRYGYESAYTMDEWQALTNNDYNSYNIDPAVISSSNLQIQPGVPTPVESSASYSGGSYEITWVDNDYFGTIRDINTPDIGAFEGDYTRLVYPPLAPSNFSPVNGASEVPINQNPLLIWGINYGDTPFSDPTYSYTYLSPNLALVNALDISARVQGDGTNLYNSYTPSTSLEQNTTYFWKVVVGNSQGTEIGSLGSFTTGASVVLNTFPIYTGFEDGTMPENWETAYNWQGDGGLNGNNLVTIPAMTWNVDMTPGNVHSGSYAATSPPMGQPSYDWLLTPFIQLPEASFPNLDFWLSYFRNDMGQTTFYLQIYAFGIWTNLLTYNTPEQSTDYDELISVDLSAYAGQIVKLAFVVGPEMTFFPVSIDDIHLYLAETGYYSFAGSIPIGDTGLELNAITLDEYSVDTLEIDTGLASSEIRDIELEFNEGIAPHPVYSPSMIGFSLSGSLEDEDVSLLTMHFEYTGDLITHIYMWSNSLETWIPVDILFSSYDPATSSGVLDFVLDLSLRGESGRNRTADFMVMLSKGDAMDIPHPDAFTLTETQQQNMQLSWNNVPDATLYKLYYADDPYANWQLLAEVAPNTTRWYLDSSYAKRFFRITSVWQP